MKNRQAIFHPDHRGRILAVRNWQHRARADDAVIAVPLDTGETRRYQEMHSQGISDEIIYTSIFGQPRVADEISVPITMLTKAQLVEMIEKRCGMTFRSLQRLCKDDLRGLLRRLAR